MLLLPRYILDSIQKYFKSQITMHVTCTCTCMYILTLYNNTNFSHCQTHTHTHTHTTHTDGPEHSREASCGVNAAEERRWVSECGGGRESPESLNASEELREGGSYSLTLDYMYMYNSLPSSFPDTYSVGWC